MTLITSTTNPRIGKLRTLQTARGRKKSGLFLLEGLNVLEAALAANYIPDEVYYQPELLRRTARGTSLLQRLLRLPEAPGERLFEVSERVIEAVSDAQTSQGVLAVLSQAILDADRLAAQRLQVSRPALLILDDIADPGNLGTILRTALAADVARVLLTPNCVDYYSPKVLRAAVGTHLFLPVEQGISWEMIAERVRQHCDGMMRVLLAEANSDQLYFAEDLTRPFALIIGNEAHGASQEAFRLATTSIHIPLTGGVESLNAGLATGVILYEAVRQKMMQ